MFSDEKVPPTLVQTLNPIHLLHRCIDPFARVRVLAHRLGSNLQQLTCVCGLLRACPSSECPMRARSSRILKSVIQDPGKLIASIMLAVGARTVFGTGIVVLALA